MKALILAAGVGRRLGEQHDGPKCLLRFGGKSLIERHIRILNACGVSEITIVVGHLAAAIEREIARIAAPALIEFCANPRYREGSIVSLWSARDVLSRGDPLLIMDADVLYDVRLMRRLVSADEENCFLLDRDVEPGDEPMKLCIRDGKIVDLHKRPSVPHDWYGETVGFTRVSAATAEALAERTDAFVRNGKSNVEYEEAIRDLIIESPGLFGFVEVEGLPWIEIDFPDDVAKARDTILPALVDG